MNEGIYVEKTDQFKRTAALVGYALFFLWYAVGCGDAADIEVIV